MVPNRNMDFAFEVPDDYFRCRGTNFDCNWTPTNAVAEVPIPSAVVVDKTVPEKPEPNYLELEGEIRKHLKNMFNLKKVVIQPLKQIPSTHWSSVGLDVLKSLYIKPGTLRHVGEVELNKLWDASHSNPVNIVNTFGESMLRYNASSEAEMAYMKKAIERKEALRKFVWEIEQSLASNHVPIYFIRDLMRRDPAFNEMMEEIACELSKRIQGERGQVVFGQTYRAEAHVVLPIKALNASHNELWHSLLQRSTILAHSVDHHTQNNLVYRFPISFKITYLEDIQIVTNPPAPVVPVEKKPTLEEFREKWKGVEITNVSQYTYLRKVGKSDLVHKATWKSTFDGDSLRVQNSIPMIGHEILPITRNDALLYRNDFKYHKDVIWKKAYETYLERKQPVRSRFQMRVILESMLESSIEHTAKVTSIVCVTLDMRTHRV